MSLAAFTYIVGELNYEGKVIDQWHRRTPKSVVTFFFSDGNRVALE
jgi:hypothetical protein